MKKTIEASLSSKEIEKLINGIKEFKEDTRQRMVVLCKRLSDEGLKVAKAQVGNSPLGRYVTLSTEISEEEMGCKAMLIGVGEVKKSDRYAPFYTLLAIEFGAGIYYNKEKNPKADEFGLGVGTFPNQIHAFEDGWYYWDEKEQKWKYSHGVKATMPMYRAQLAIMEKVKGIAKEVFN